ncbi:MAG: hypothetical protein Q4P17_06515 [Methanobacterium sp.]|nr:hypothetical protein [Methanobacterium sp.]
MQVDIDHLEESDKGWDVRVKAILNSEEFSQLNTASINDIEDFKVDIHGSVIYFNSFLSIAEPWEDEPLEELVKAIKLEVEYWVLRLLNKNPP